MYDDIMSDKLNEECGVFGIFGNENASRLTYYGLHALQHRGQESCGIVVSDGSKIRYQKGMGLVSDVFKEKKAESLVGHQAIGHVRYTVNGEDKLADAQPLVIKYREGTFALAHNGSLVNASQIKRYLERQGSIFQTTSDTEVIAHLIARSAYDNIEEAFIEALSMIKGAYALVLMTENKLIAALDPNGIRPLSMGRLDDGYVFSSETCAFDLIGAEYEREVKPGELIVINQDGRKTYQFTKQTQKSVCSFEYIYFARPDSNINGINVHLSRKELGRQLALEHSVEADVITGVPDSSLSAAIGYAESTGISYELALIKNRYVGRTFIKPTQEKRELGVFMKLSAVRKVIEGQRVVMVDDSIVRGTTSSRIVKMLRDAGAKEVHVRISSPPVAHSCFYGIDTSAREQLIVATKSVEEIREFIGADSLAFLSTDGLLNAIGKEETCSPNNGLCLACFTGNYPTEIYQNTVGENNDE